MSDLVEQLKTVKEYLPNDYSSDQLFSVLDEFIYRSIEQAIIYTDFFDLVIANILPWYGNNGRRKITSLEKNKLLKLILLFLITENPRTKCKLLKKMQFERNILFSSLNLFVSKTSGYNILYAQSFKTKHNQKIRKELLSIEDSVMAKGDLYCCNNNLKFWLDNAIRFKNYMIEKYMRHVVNKATFYVASSKGNVVLEDVCQNFLLAVSKAIDKFNIGKGTLKPYVELWIRSAQLNSIHDHEYGVAFKISQSIKQSIATGNSSVRNISVELPLVDTYTKPVDGPEQIVGKSLNITNVQRLAKLADPEGYGRIELDIQEVLSKKEKIILERCKI